MIRIAPGVAVLTALLIGPLWGQATNDELLARLGSRYSGVREDAIRTLSSRPPDDRLLVAALASDDPRIRMGSARVIAGAASATCVPALVDGLRHETDRRVREVFAVALFDLVCRSGAPGKAQLEQLTADATLAAAAARFVRAELERAEREAIPWSHHRRFSRFLWMGPYAEPALSRIVFDESASQGLKCLAVIALGRVEGKRFWIDAGGGLSPRFRKALSEGEDELRMALLYSLGASGHATPELANQVARFAREDAFGAYVIEAALYVLYTLDEPVRAAAEPEMKKCVEEFLDGFYGEIVLFNVAWVLRGIQDPSWADTLVKRVTSEEEPTFAHYWLLESAFEYVDRVTDKPRAAALRDRLVEWGLAASIPQLRVLSAAVHKESAETWPEGFDAVAARGDVRKSIEEHYPSDTELYAKRAGAAALARLGDQASGPLVRRLLEHSNEAVRMATAFSAGNGEMKALAPALRRLAAKDEEYAAYGAAWALCTMRLEGAQERLVDILESGNDVLMRSALTNIRWLEDRKIEESVPRTKVAWARRASQWRAAIKSRP